MIGKDFIIMRGDVVWAENPYSDGHIQSSRRPYLIVSNNSCNFSSSILTAIPFTTAQNKTNIPTHYNFMINNKYNCALCEQITCINRYNITQYIDTIEDKDLREIEKRMKIQLDLKEGNNDASTTGQRV